MGALVGAVMKASKGQADGKAVTALLNARTPVAALTTLPVGAATSTFDDNTCRGSPCHDSFVANELGATRRSPALTRRGARRVSTLGRMDFEIPADIQDTLDRARRVHRGGDQAAGAAGRQHPVLRPPPGVRADRLRERRRAARRTGRTCCAEMRRRADAAGWLRHALPAEYGGQDATNLEMAIIREHLASEGPRAAQRPAERVLDRRQLPDRADDARLRHRGAEGRSGCPGFLDGTRRLAFGLTEPNHGSDATYLETTAVRDGDEWVINGMKRFNSGLHHATHDIIFARTSGDDGSPKGITASSCPTDAPGFKVEFFWWTFNMPTDHAEVTLTDVRVGADALVRRGRPRPRAGPALRAREPHPPGRVVARRRAVLHQRGGRLRRTSASPGASRCRRNQAIQFPLVELHTEAAMLRQLSATRRGCSTSKHHMEVTHHVAMCNYRANRLACEAADRAMQTCGGIGYTRHMPFEHIYRHHRRYRITEGSEEIQMRKVGQHLFGFGRQADGTDRPVPSVTSTMCAGGAAPWPRLGMGRRTSRRAGRRSRSPVHSRRRAHRGQGRRRGSTVSNQTVRS